MNARIRLVALSVAWALTAIGWAAFFWITARILVGPR